MFFNQMVNILCLISSYYYGYVACFRYHDNHATQFIVITSAFEFIFLIHMALQFLVEFTPEGSKVPVTDLARISMNYINGEFALDFIPILPFYVLTGLDRNR